MRSVNPEMEEAVRILGGGRLTAIRHVRGAAAEAQRCSAAWLLVFIPATRELSSAIFLVGPNTRIISVLLFDLSEEGNFEVLVGARHASCWSSTLAIVGIGFQADRPRLHAAEEHEVPSCVLRNLQRRFGDVAAVDGVDLTLREGEFVSLLGPSGCGKTTTLRMIAGFIDADRRHHRDGWRGALLAGRSLPPEKRADVDDLPELRDLAEHDGGAERRLRPGAAQAAARGDRAGRVDEILDVVQMGHLADRYPAELSGGQQQRVALARAIVVTAVGAAARRAALEPRRQSARGDALRDPPAARRIPHHHGLRDARPGRGDGDLGPHRGDEPGRIEQVDDPYALYNRPKTRFVAGFIGRTNFLEGRVARGRAACSMVFRCRSNSLGQPPGADDERVVLSIRPQSMTLHSGQPADRIAVAARVVECAYLGEHWEYLLVPQGGDARLRVTAAPTQRHQPGDEVWIGFDPAQIVAIT